MAFKSPAVQTYVINKITSYLSYKLGTDIRIKAVDIKLLKTLVLKGVYVEDQKKDTLLYINDLDVDISKFDLGNRLLSIKSVKIKKGYSKVERGFNDPDYNYQFILDAFASSDTSASGAAWDISFNKLVLDDFVFKYKDGHDTSTYTGMNYFDLAISNIHTTITSVYFDSDTIYATIEQLSAKEKCGFYIKNFSGEVKLSPIALLINNMIATTERSNVATNLRFAYSEYEDYYDFINQVKMEAQFDKSVLWLDDIAYFAPELKGINQKINISGKVYGTVKKIRGQSVDIALGESTRYKGGILINGLPGTDTAYFHLAVEKLVFNKKDIEMIPQYPFVEGEKIELPSNIDVLGDVTFKGAVTGRLKDFKTFGQFSTDIGEVTVDMYVNSLQELTEYKGKVTTIDFDAGRVFKIDPLLGNITSDLRIDGAGLTFETAKVTINGSLETMSFNGYNYHNVLVFGDVKNKSFVGHLDIRDQHATLAMDATIDATSPHLAYEFDCSVSNADLFKLNLVGKNYAGVLSSEVKMAFTGNDIENIEGNFNVSALKYEAGKNVLSVNKADLIVSSEGKRRKLSFISDIADIDVSGDFMFNQLQASFINMLSEYFPAYYSSNKRENVRDQSIDFRIKIKDMASFNDIFIPGFYISTGAIAEGFFRSQNSHLELKSGASEIDMYGKKVYDLTLIAGAGENGVRISSMCKRFCFSDSVFVDNMNVEAGAKNDSVKWDVNWEQKKPADYSGTLSGLSVLGSDKSFNTMFKKGEVSIADSMWVLSPGASVLWDSAGIKVADFLFSHNHEKIDLKGIVSYDPRQVLQVDVSDLNLNSYNQIFRDEDLRLEGLLSGRIELSDAYKKQTIISKLEFFQLVVNDDKYGDGIVESKWDKEKEALMVNAVFSKGIVPNIMLSGFFYPMKKENSLDFTLETKAMRMESVQPFVKDYCSYFSGSFSSKIKINGTPDHPLLKGYLDVNAKKVQIDYLNVAFHFNHKFVIDNNEIIFDSLRLVDTKYHTSALVTTGRVYHDNFKKIQLDIDILCDKLLALNTTETMNSLYYGQAFVSGKVNIFGFLDKVTIDAALKTEKIYSLQDNKPILSKFYIPLTGTEEISESSFITFVKKDHKSSKEKEKYIADQGGIKMNFVVDVTPDAEIQMIFDPKVGDIIKGSGQGSITMDINTNGDFKMYGDIEIEKGDYLFTLKNLINKKFDIAKGGTLKWSGDPYNADIDMAALYKVRTSLSPLFPFDSSGVYSRRYPVNCTLLMKDKLLAPQILFDIDLPSVDENTRQQVRNIVSNEQELNKQVFSLLVLNSFVTPAVYKDAVVGGGGSGASAGTANSTEVLSNQLNNMLSKISKDFDLGINYRPGDEISSEELQLAMSTQLFNNKVSIDGNVGVNNNNQNTNNIVGDVNVEYKVSEDGKLKVKAFNRANDNTQTTTNAPYTQGVGAFYREEFDTIGELYIRYLEKVKRLKRKKVS